MRSYFSLNNNNNKLATGDIYVASVVVARHTRYNDGVKGLPGIIQGEENQKLCQ